VIKALIFDFDGLIMDTESPEVDSWKAIYAKYGQEFPLEVWIRDVVGSSIANFDPAAHLAAITSRSFDLPALHARVRA
jgi:beta-phosphoglucomutase-like phosphatase (HAD superfamily)